MTVSPELVFVSLPLPLRMMFVNPSKMPKAFNWRQYDVDLRSFAFSTAELDQLISMFLVVFEQHKQRLQPYFRLFSRIRNQSVHAALPKFQHYDLERVAYLVLSLAKIVSRGRNLKCGGSV